MNDQYAGEVRGNLEDFDEYLDAGLGYEQVSNGSGRILISASIWVVTILAAAVLAWLGQPVIGMVIAGVVALIHGCINPRVALYILLFILPIDWMVGVIPGVTTMVKLIAAWVLVVSVPGLLRAAGSGRWDPIIKWMVLLLLWAGVSCLWARYKIAGLLFWQTMVLIWGMSLLICFHLKSRAILQMGLIFLITGCLLSNTLLIATGDVYRFEATYIRPELRAIVGAAEAVGELNITPRYFSLAIFASVFFIITLKGIIKKLLFVFVIIFLSIGIILGKGRAVYVAMPAALVGSVLLLKGGGVSKRALLMIMLGLLVGATALVVAKLGLFGPAIRERFESIFEAGIYAGQRIHMWKAHIEAFIETGFRGVGPNQMMYTAKSLYLQAHNDVLAIMGELGIVGLAAFMGLHICLFRRIIRLTDQWTKMFCLMIWCFIILAGMTQNDYYRKYYGLAVGLILAAIRIGENEPVGVEESSVESFEYDCQ
jgi:O-antigen ligase